MAAVLRELQAGGSASGASAASSLATLVNSSVGAGLLSLPFAFSCAGWAGGLLATAAVAASEAFTLYWLSRAAEATGTASYGSLVAHMLGPGASVLLSVVLVLYLFGSSVAYLLIIGDCLVPPLQQAFGAGWWASRSVVVSGTATAFILPLCFPTSLDSIWAASALKVVGLTVVVGAVALRSVQIISSPGHSWAPLRAFDPSLRFFQALPILVFGFQCHTNVISVFEELEAHPELFRSGRNLVALLRRSLSGRAGSGGSAAALEASGSGGEGGEWAVQQGTGLPVQAPNGFAATVGGAGGGALPGAAATGPGSATPSSSYQRLPQLGYSRSMRSLKSRKLKGMTRIVLAAVAVSAVFYAAVGMAGYLAFPAGVASDVLSQFALDDPIIQVARVMVGVTQIASFPVNHFPARLAVRDLLQYSTGRSFEGRLFNVVETLCFFVSSLGLALLITDLGIVFQLIGGSCGVTIVFAVPGALLVQHARLKHLQSRQQLEEAVVPLLEEGASNGAQEEQQQQQRRGLRQRRGLSAGRRGGVAPYRCLTSKIWWAGMGLLPLSACLFALTIYTILWPPA